MTSKTLPLYLDYHATTPCAPQVFKAMEPYFGPDKFGNPSALSHKNGQAANACIVQAKEKLAALLGGVPEGYILTGGATEANNIALLGLARANPHRREILVGCLEHASVANAAKHLEEEGFTVKVIPSTPEGFITPEAVSELISDQTLLVSVMAANHEIGTIQPIEKIAEVAHQAGAYFHSDATQAVGKIPLNVEEMNIDLLSLSAHKFYGPQGIGALYVRPHPRIEISPVMFGGNQQGIRSGTMPVALAVGLGEACDVARNAMEKQAARLDGLSRLMLDKLAESGVEFKVNGALKDRLPGSLNLCFSKIRAEDMLRALGDEICVSTGSACASKKAAPSPVLTAIGLRAEEIENCVRISFGRPTTEDDVLFAVDRLIAAMSPCVQSVA